MAARIDYFDETAIADVGMRVSGNSFEELLQAAAQGLLGLMISDPDKLPEGRPRTLSLEDVSAELLLRALLEEMVFLKDAENIVLVAEGVTVTPPGMDTNVPRREAEGAAGRPGSAVVQAEISCREIELADAGDLYGIDVKAVTFHDFQVERRDSGEWYAQVIFDV